MVVTTYPLFGVRCHNHANANANANAKASANAKANALANRWPASDEGAQAYGAARNPSTSGASSTAWVTRPRWPPW